MDILIVADSEGSTSRLNDSLLQAGHRVRTATGVGEAVLAARTSRTDAVIADARQVQPSELRRRIPGIPIVAWIDTASTESAALLLEDGADEVVHIGMGTREQLARIASLSSRAPSREPALELGPLRVDRERGEASWHGRRLALTPRERDVLHELAAARGATVRREALYRAVWGYAMARGDRTVDVNVRRLRAKLDTTVGSPLVIETEPGVGYRLIVADSAVTAL